MIAGRTWAAGLRGRRRRRDTGGRFDGLFLIGKDLVQPCLDAGDGLRQEGTHAPFGLAGCSSLTGHGSSARGRTRVEACKGEYRGHPRIRDGQMAWWRMACWI